MKPVRVATVAFAAFVVAVGAGLWFVASHLRTIGERERAREVFAELASDDVEVHSMAMAKSDRIAFERLLPGLVELSSDPRPAVQTTLAQLTYLMTKDRQHVVEMRSAFLPLFVRNATSDSAAEHDRLWALHAVNALHVRDPADVRALAALAENPTLTPDVRDYVIRTLYESRCDEVPMIAEVVEDLRRRRTPNGGITKAK